MSNPHEARRRTAPDRTAAGDPGAKAATLRGRKPQGGNSVADRPAPDKAAALRKRSRQVEPPA